MRFISRKSSLTNQKTYHFNWQKLLLSWWKSEVFQVKSSLNWLKGKTLQVYKFSDIVFKQIK